MLRLLLALFKSDRRATQPAVEPAPYKPNVVMPAEIPQDEYLREARPQTAVSDPALERMYEKFEWLRPGPDYMGLAAIEKRLALEAVKTGEHDKAWRHFHQYKLLHMQRTSEPEYTNAQRLEWDSNIHEEMANMLRIEGKHDQALFDILYWIMGARTRIKRHDQKLAAYFRRCKWRHTTLDEVVEYSRQGGLADGTAIAEQVRVWRDRG